MIYVDSCALVKLIVVEKESAALSTAISGRRADLVTSELALTEVVRTVRRSGFDDQRRARIDPAVLEERLTEAAGLLDEIDLIVLDTATLLNAAIYEDDPHVGTLDAIHLVSAREIESDLESFITYDRRLAHAAKAAGLPLLQPGEAA
jgi:predicted nucleic acid-binding protein